MHILHVNQAVHEMLKTSIFSPTTVLAQHMNQYWLLS